MAQRAKAADAAIKANGYDGKTAQAFVRKIEDHLAEIESSKGAHMNRCQKIRGSIDVVYEEAKALGIPKKVLRAHVDLRGLEKRKAGIVEKLNDDEAETFEAIADALGEFATLPLGMAALRNAEASDEDAAALASLQ